jgi:hypothetical protein
MALSYEHGSGSKLASCSNGKQAGRHPVLRLRPYRFVMPLLNRVHKAPDEPCPPPSPGRLRIFKRSDARVLPVSGRLTLRLPLANGLVQKITGCTEAEAEETIRFNTTD